MEHETAAFRWQIFFSFFHSLGSRYHSLHAGLHIAQCSSGRVQAHAASYSLQRSRRPLDTSETDEAAAASFGARRLRTWLCSCSWSARQSVAVDVWMLVRLRKETDRHIDREGKLKYQHLKALRILEEVNADSHKWSQIAFWFDVIFSKGDNSPNCNAWP